MLSALAGGGAVLLQLPALIFLGLPFAIALATHKVASVALGVGATLRYLRGGGLTWPFSLFILACGLPGVVLGASVILHVPERIAEFTLGMLTIGLGVYSWLQPELGLARREVEDDVSRRLTGGLVLCFIGIVNGSLTSGSGLFVTLWLVRWFGLEYKHAVAYTLVLVGVFWNGAGALTLGVQGTIRWDWLPALLLGSLIGGYLGAHLAVVKGNRFVKRVFEVVTVLVGVKLVAG
jgi:uncharacterized protein